MVKSSYAKLEKFRKVKVLKSVNLHPEYVPRYFRNEMQKKVEYKLTSKKNYGHSSRHA